MAEIAKIDDLVQKGELVLSTHKPNPPNTVGFPTLDYADFVSWKTQTINFLKQLLPEGSVYTSSFEEEVNAGYVSKVKAGIGILNALKEDLQTELVMDEENIKGASPIELVNNICDRLHVMVRQLRSRYNDRPTLDVKDEYDVQDLMHTLLHLHFSDVRREEWTPSYAGQCSRMDFLLKKEQLIIEIKKTRRNLRDREIGSQLIEDTARYKAHQDCETFMIQTDLFLTLGV